MSASALEAASAEHHAIGAPGPSPFDFYNQYFGELLDQHLPDEALVSIGEGVRTGRVCRAALRQWFVETCARADNMVVELGHSRDALRVAFTRHDDKVEGLERADALLRTHAASQDAKLVVQNATITNLRQKLATQDAKFVAQDSTIAELREENATLHANIAHLLQLCGELKTRVDAHDRRLESMEVNDK